VTESSSRSVAREKIYATKNEEVNLVIFILTIGFSSFLPIK